MSSKQFIIPYVIGTSAIGSLSVYKNIEQNTNSDSQKMSKWSKIFLNTYNIGLGAILGPFLLPPFMIAKSVEKLSPKEDQIICIQDLESV